MEKETRPIPGVHFSVPQIAELVGFSDSYVRNKIYNHGVKPSAVGRVQEGPLQCHYYHVDDLRRVPYFGWRFDAIARPRPASPPPGTVPDRFEHDYLPEVPPCLSERR